ncbi:MULTISPECIES: PhoX family protein [unclassified Nocardioides]|uniref:PhoX family protein n=1 Tax=unclassified Nocardioides TaxID=2615069 RepID=UPI00301546C9
MTSAPQQPALLPLLPSGPHGSRDAMTCLFRCGNACDRPEPNGSGNGHLRDEVARVVQRRSLLKGAGVGAGVLALGGLAVEPAAAAGPARRGEGRLGRVDFTPVPPNRRDAVVVPPGFRQDVVVRWGDPVLPGAPAFDAYRQTPEAAAQQFGFNNDYVGLVELPRRSDRDRALLVVNHEYTTGTLMFPTGRYDAETQLRIEMQSHGMSVVTVERGQVAGSWRRVTPARARHNRRVTIDTAFRVTGPAAGDPRLRTAADPTGRRVLGTLNNCAGGTTPWGTVLSGEENVNQYFDASDGIPAEHAESFARYGITGEGRGWSAVDPRFDLSTEPHEAYRFGWIVELDPLSPGSAPRKHTMLGRFKHEGANISIARNGRAVAYLGDDERGDYLYKFVSRDRYDDSGRPRARAHNKTLLEHGTLFVARLTGDGTADGVYDGTGTWLPLTSDTTSYVPGMSVADVLLNTRLAADRRSPTRMDRPEDVEPNPVNGRVYAALTNNSGRGTAQPADEANPVTSSQTRPALGEPLVTQSGNRNGYVLELIPRGGDHASTTFTWNLLLVCGDPAAQETYFGGYDKSRVSPISCPDNVTFDPQGNLWVSTDGNVLGSNDGIFRVPVSGAERGRVQQFVTVPRGAEACGPLVTDGGRSLFFAVQHPGEITGATFEAPASTWPHTDDFPRPSVVVAYRSR